jgi:hypothetical protein
MAEPATAPDAAMPREMLARSWRCTELKVVACTVVVGAVAAVTEGEVSVCASAGTGVVATCAVVVIAVKCAAWLQLESFATGEVEEDVRRFHRGAKEGAREWGICAFSGAQQRLLRWGVR